MILRRTNDNYAKILLESGLLKRFYWYGDVHVMINLLSRWLFAAFVVVVVFPIK